VCGAADGTLRVGVKVGERRELLACLLVGERIGEDRVLGQLGEADVARHVVTNTARGLSTFAVHVLSPWLRCASSASLMLPRVSAT
jgi:hypothetical protein